MKLEIFRKAAKTYRQRLVVLLLATGFCFALLPCYGAIPVEFAGVDLGGLVNQLFNQTGQKSQKQPDSSTNRIDSRAPLEITSVGQIYPQQSQSIVIVGYGFGTQNAFSGTSAFLRIHDDTDNWDLGWSGNNDPNPANVNVKLWNDKLILISGLTGSYGMNGRVLNPGDKLTISVWNPQTGKGPASTNVVVSSPISQVSGVSLNQSSMASHTNDFTNSLFQQMLIGEWAGEGLDDGRIVYAAFATNGTVILRNVQHSEHATYSVDWSQRPYYLNVTSENGATDESIFEFTDTGMRVEDGRMQARPTSFTDKAEVLKKVTNHSQDSELFGEWTGKDHAGQMTFLAFAPGGLYKVEENGKIKEGTYLVDWSKNPPHLDVDQGDGLQELIFDVSGFGLRIEGSNSGRPSQFTSNAVILKKANDIKNELSSGNFTAAYPPLWSDWVGEDPNGYVLHFVFTPDGSIVIQQAGGSRMGKYAVDLSQSPPCLDILWNDNSGVRAIFVIDGQELHVEGDNTPIRPLTFSDSALVLRKADLAFQTKLQGSWIGGIDASQIMNLGHVDTNQIMALCTVLTFAPGGVIQSQGHGPSKEGTYAVDGNTNPAYLDIKWGDDAVDERTCRFQSIAKNNVPLKEALFILPGRGQETSPQSMFRMAVYSRISAEDIKKLPATLQLGQAQPQAAQTSPNNSINGTQGQANGTIPYNSNSLQAVPQGGNQNTALPMLQPSPDLGSVRIYQLPANTGWRDTGIDITSGQSISIIADGTLTVELNSPYTAPAGRPAPVTNGQIGNTLHAKLQPQSLQGRIGTGGTPFDIGTRTTLPASSNGRLFLRLNDTYFGANSAEWYISVIGGNLSSQPAQNSGTVPPSASQVSPTTPQTGSKTSAIQSTNASPIQAVKNEKPRKHIPVGRYLIWCVAGLAIIGMAIAIFRLIVPRRENMR